MYTIPRLLTGLLLSSLFASGAAMANDSGDSKPGNKTPPAQIFSIDGTLYGCAPGSQAKGVALGQCTKLPGNVVDLINAAGSKVPSLSSSSTSTTTTPTSTNSTDDTPETTIVSTPSGPMSCPVTAFTSSKQLDVSQCTASTAAKRITAVCRPADSTGTTGATTTSSTASTTSTLLTCAMPGETQSKNPLPKFDSACAGGGTHQVTGGYDSKTGKIDITITFTACKDEQGVTHDGSAIMQGTLTADATTANVYQMDETKTINSTLLFPNGGSMTRACTVSRKGSYNNSNGDFKGTVTRTNCTMSGDYRFKRNLVDNLIENASAAEPI